MNFEPFNFPLKIQKSIETPTPKVGAHFGVWEVIPSHSPTLLGTWNVTLGLHSWPAPLQALALVASSKLGLRRKDISMVMTILEMVGSLDNYGGIFAKRTFVVIWWKLCTWSWCKRND
jgi:hypothetical protein